MPKRSTSNPIKNSLIITVSLVVNHIQNGEITQRIGSILIRTFSCLFGILCGSMQFKRIRVIHPLCLITNILRYTHYTEPENDRTNLLTFNCTVSTGEETGMERARHSSIRIQTGFQVSINAHLHFNRISNIGPKIKDWNRVDCCWACTGLWSVEHGQHGTGLVGLDSAARFSV